MDVKNLWLGANFRTLPSLNVSGVEPADINVGAMVGKFTRGAREEIPITDMEQAKIAFGEYDYGMYGMFGIKAFFDNLQGTPGLLWVRRLIPTDAVTASRTIENENGTDAIRISAGFRGVEDPGKWGNEVFTFLKGNEETVTTVNADIVSATPSTTITVESVLNLNVGDVIEIGDVTTVIRNKSDVLKTITVDEITSVAGLSIGDPVIRKTFDIYVVKANEYGTLDIIEEFTNLGIITTGNRYFINELEDELTGSFYIKAEHLSTVDKDLAEDFPVIDGATYVEASVIALTGGADGGGLTITDFEDALKDFSKTGVDPLWLCSSELTNDAEYGAMINYIGTRNNGQLKDIVAIVTPETPDNTDNQLVVWGKRKQEAKELPAFLIGQWLWITDPISLAPTPRILVPSPPSVMGYAIFEQVSRGVHKVPASRRTNVIGLEIENEITNPDTIRDLHNAGVNVMNQFGNAINLRSAVTPSVIAEWRWVNVFTTRTFLKKTIESIIPFSENETDPDGVINYLTNNIGRILEDFEAGSSNGGEEGGFYPEDQAWILTIKDPKLNPPSEIRKGVIKVNIMFAPSVPTEKILVGFGVIWNR